MRVVLDALISAKAYDPALAMLDDYLSGPAAQCSIEGLLPNSALDPVGDDPRFEALVEKYGRKRSRAWAFGRFQPTT